MKRFSTWYIVVLHLLLIAVLWKSDFLSRVKGRFETTPPPELSNYYHRILRYHERSVDIVPDNAVIFIGDSITQGLTVAAVAPNAVNYGIGSDTTFGVLRRLSSYRNATEDASVIVIAIGINDLSKRTNDEIVSNYKSILDVLPVRPIVISSILPVDESVASRMIGNNQRISSLNNRLVEIASRLQHVYFLDNTTSLDENGDMLLDLQFHTGDGVHLNSLGNTIWVANLRGAISNAVNSSD